MPALGLLWPGMPPGPALPCLPPKRPRSTLRLACTASSSTTRPTAETSIAALWREALAAVCAEAIAEVCTALTACAIARLTSTYFRSAVLAVMRDAALTTGVALTGPDGDLMALAATPDPCAFLGDAACHAKTVNESHGCDAARLGAEATRGVAKSGAVIATVPSVPGVLPAGLSVEDGSWVSDLCSDALGGSGAPDSAGTLLVLIELDFTPDAVGGLAEDLRCHCRVRFC